MASGGKKIFFKIKEYQNILNSFFDNFVKTHVYDLAQLIWMRK